MKKFVVFILGILLVACSSTRINQHDQDKDSPHSNFQPDGCRTNARIGDSNTSTGQPNSDRSGNSRNTDCHSRRHLQRPFSRSRGQPALLDGEWILHHR